MSSLIARREASVLVLALVLACRPEGGTSHEIASEGGDERLIDEDAHVDARSLQLVKEELGTVGHRPSVARSPGRANGPGAGTRSPPRHIGGGAGHYRA